MWYQLIWKWRTRLRLRTFPTFAQLQEHVLVSLFSDRVIAAE
jgi:hypothetical protein